jgi:hypothetical protein
MEGSGNKKFFSSLAKLVREEELRIKEYAVTMEYVG